ncbi:MAG: hypothetical protein ACLQF0_14565 [Dissulfurispiraceae bacterium]
MCQGNTETYPGAHVEYSFHIVGVTFEPFSVPLSDPRFTEARFIMREGVNPEDNNCTLMLFLGPVVSIEDADQIADSIKDQLLELFSLIVGCRVSRTRIVGHNLVPRPGEGGQIHGIFPVLRLRLSGHSEPRRLANDEIHSIEIAFSRISTFGEGSLLRIFRYAMDADDEIVKFLMLYLILNLLRSLQREIDELIIAIAPGVDQTPDPRNPSVWETCYTRLRNEIMHRDVDHEATRQEISQRVYEFTNIVRTAIRQEYHL